MKSLYLVFLLSCISLNSLAYVNLNYQALAKNKVISNSFCATTFNKDHSLVLNPCVQFNDDRSKAFINVGVMSIISTEPKINESIVKELIDTSLYGTVQRTFHSNGDVNKIIVTPTKFTNEIFDINVVENLVFQIDENYQTLTIDHNQFGSHTFYANPAPQRIVFQYLRDRDLLVKEWLDNHMFKRNALHDGIINLNGMVFYIQKSSGKLKADYTQPGRQEIYIADVNIIKKNNKIFIQLIDSETKKQVYMLNLDKDGLFLQDVSQPDIVFIVQWKKGKMVKCSSGSFKPPHYCNIK